MYLRDVIVSMGLRGICRPSYLVFQGQVGLVTVTSARRISCVQEAEAGEPVSISDFVCGLLSVGRP